MLGRTLWSTVMRWNHVDEMRTALRRGTSPTLARPASRLAESMTGLRKVRGSGRVHARRRAVDVRAAAGSGPCGACGPRWASQEWHSLGVRLGDGRQAGARFPLLRARRVQMLDVPLQEVVHHPTWGDGTAGNRVAALPSHPAGRTWPMRPYVAVGKAGHIGLRVGLDGQEVVPEAEGSSTGIPSRFMARARAMGGACAARVADISDLR